MVGMSVRKNRQINAIDSFILKLLPRLIPPFEPSRSKTDSASSFTMNIVCGPYTLVPGY